MSHVKSTTAQVCLRTAEQGMLHGTVTGTGRGAARFVRVTLISVAGTVVQDEHLRADAEAPSRVREIADVLVGAARPADCGDAAVVAMPHGEWCLLRCGVDDGRRPVVRVRLGAAHREQAPWAAWASVAHAWLVAGLPAEALATAVLNRPEVFAAQGHLEG